MIRKERKDKNKAKSSEVKLPRILSFYNKSDFTTRQKARIFYYLCIAAIASVVVLVFTSGIIHLNSTRDSFFNRVLIVEVVLILILLLCLRILRIGKLNLAAQIFIVSANLSAWLAMLFSQGDPVARFDTVILILAIVNAIPLFISKYQWSIFIYVGVNILFFTFFIINQQIQLELTNSEIIALVTDSTIAFIFTGIVGSQILKINKKAVEKLRIDYQERLQAEQKLARSEHRYRNIFENAQVGIYQTTPEGNILQANPAMLQLHGISSFDKLVNKNLDEVDVYLNKNRDEFIQKIERDGFVKDFEATWTKKNGESIMIRENARAVRDENGKTRYYEGFVINITERKKVEKALKENEEKYRSLMENMNDIVMLVDNNDKVLFVNQRFSEKLGYSEEEIIGKIGFEVLIDPKDHQKIITANKERENNVSNQYEATFVSKNGQKHDFLISGAPMKDADGKVVGSIGNMIDITERKIAAEKLRKSQQLFQTLAQSSPVGIFRTRADGYTTYVNPKWMEISGLSSEEAFGNGWLQAVHPDDKRSLQENWVLRTSRGESSTAEYRFVKDNGSIVWVLGNAVAEIINGEIQGYIGTITDITDRKIAEQKIKESEERYRTIIEAFPDIIMISDLDKNILFANESLEKITGITPNDYNNPNRKAHIHPDDMPLIDREIESLLSGKQTHTGILESRFIDTWGNEHWFNGIISKMNYNGQLVLQTISRDITDKKLIEDELRKHREHLEELVKERTEELAAANEELVSTNEELQNQREELEVILKNLQNTQKKLVQSEKMASLGVLASGVAHEINNPLNFIRGGAFGLNDYFEENLPDHTKNVEIFLHSINEGVDRAASIVTSLNHYSHRDESKISDCNIHDIIDNCLNILRNQIRDVISIEKNYTTTSYLVKCNEGKMHQAILNILTNAVQSIDGHGDIKIKTRTGSKANEVRIMISDTGSGISKENLSRIFDPFFTTKDPGQGTGLGLSITYNIIEENKGTIEIDSELYKGTTVLITLPIIKN